MGVFDLFKKKEQPEPGARAGQGSAPAPQPAESAPEPAAAASKQSWFGMLRSALKKTNDVLNTDIRDLFKREGRLVDEEFLRELFAILVKTDMGAGPASRIRDRIGSDFRARVVHMEEVLASVKDEIRKILEQPEQPIQLAASGPTVILVVGVNGSGKTTSIAKLAHMFRAQGKSVVLGAGDTFRAAAVEQLTIWADRLGVEIIKAGQGGGTPRPSLTGPWLARSSCLQIFALSTRRAACRRRRI